MILLKILRLDLILNYELIKIHKSITYNVLLIFNAYDNYTAPKLLIFESDNDNYFKT